MSQRKIRVEEFTQRRLGEPFKLYVGTVLADQLQAWAEIDIYDAGKNPLGYQRAPIEYRAKQVSTYVRNQEGILPTAVLVNIRDGYQLKPDGPNGQGGPATLVLAPSTKLWIVDGQHRLRGLQDATERLQSSDPEATLGYSVPVVFTLGMTRSQEMRLFDVVNSRAKSVPTDLAAQLIRREFQESGRANLLQSGRATERDLRKAIGTKVAYHLNGTPGPWMGKIRLPNQSKDNRSKPLQVNAIASSLEPALRDQYVRSIYDTESETQQEWPTLCGLVHTYWSSLAELMPEAFADIENYTVQRTAGVYAFHQILPDVLYRCFLQRRFSTATFSATLSDLGRFSKSDTWHHDSSETLTRSTGMAQIRTLADQMRMSLAPLEAPELPTQDMPEAS